MVAITAHLPARATALPDLVASTLRSSGSTLTVNAHYIGTRGGYLLVGPRSAAGTGVAVTFAELLRVPLSDLPAYLAGRVNNTVTHINRAA